MVDADKQVVPAGEVTFVVDEVAEDKTVQSVRIRQIANAFLVEVQLKDDVTGEYSEEELAFESYAEVLDYLATIGS